MANARRAGLRLAGLRFLGAALRKPPPPFLRPSGRILLIRPDHLGDVLLTTPALSALRTSLPGATLDALVGPWSADVAQRGARLDRISTCAFPGFNRASAGWPGAPYVELIRQARRLRACRYELAIIFRPDHWWGALLAAVAGIPLRLGYAVPECAPLLTHALPVPAGVHTTDLSRALVNRAVSLAGTEMHEAAPSPQFRIDSHERDWAGRCLSELTIGPDDPLAILHPGSGAEIKLWAPERWARIVDALSDRYRYRLLVTYARTDSDVVEHIGRHTSTPMLAVPTDHGLGYLAALLERANLVLGVDSGPLHLATALGRPTLRLYGPTDPDLYGPRPAGTSQRLLRVQLPCSPCGNIVDPPCGAKHDPLCLSMISTEAVLDEIGTLLAVQAGR